MSRKFIFSPLEMVITRSKMSHTGWDTLRLNNILFPELLCVLSLKFFSFDLVHDR